MILENLKQTNIETVGESEDSIKMEMDTSSQQHLMMLLSTNLYSDNIGSIVREYTCNALDAHRAANVNEPILVSLKRTNQGDFEFSVEDFGTGLDDNDFRNIMSMYGKSTKRDSNEFIGAMGIGSKSAYSYTDNFHYRCRKDGVERLYIMYKDEEGFRIDLLNTMDTTEKNGVKVIIPVRTSDVETYINRIKTQLAYFESVYFNVENRWGTSLTNLNNFRIFRSEDFQWSEMEQSDLMHICLDNVYYPIDFAKMGIPHINVPIGLRFSLSDGLFPTPNREAIKYTKETIAIIKDKIRKVAEYMVSKYNDTIQSFDNIIEAWDHIDVEEHSLKINDELEVYINDLIPYSSYPIDDVIVKDCVIHSPSDYKNMYRDLIAEYDLVAEYTNATWKTVKLRNSLYSLLLNSLKTHSGKIYQVDSLPVGNFKEYVKDTVRCPSFFIRKKFTQKLRYDGKDSPGLYSILNLSKVPKTEWRAYITEFQKVKEAIINATTIDIADWEFSLEFKEWITKRDEERKAFRKANPHLYLGLNKQEGDVTIAYQRFHAKTFESGVYTKKVYPVAQVRKNDFLTVYLHEKDDPRIQIMNSLYNGLSSEICENPIPKKMKIKFAIIGSREANKIKNLHNFKTMDEFMSPSSKPFRRMVTAWKIADILSLYDVTYGFENTIVRECLNRFSDQVNILRNYHEDNYISKTQEHVKAQCLQVAENLNIWDLSIWHILKEVESKMKEFDFIRALKAPESWSSVEQKKLFNKTINELLLFRKLYANKYEGFTLAAPPEPESLSEDEISEIENELELVEDDDDVVF